jgi:hypothetical protein
MGSIPKEQKIINRMKNGILTSHPEKERKGNNQLRFKKRIRMVKLNGLRETKKGKKTES